MSKEIRISLKIPTKTDVANALTAPVRSASAFIARHRSPTKTEVTFNRIQMAEWLKENPEGTYSDYQEWRDS